MVRFKHRYLLVEILCEDGLGGHAGAIPSGFGEGALVTVIRESVAVNFGDAGAAEVGGALSVKYFSPATRLAIVRVSRAAHRTVWAALTFVRQIKGVGCCIRVLHCGGTIRKTQQEAIRRDRKALLAAHGAATIAAAATISPAPPGDPDLLKRLERSTTAIMAIEP